jgi:thiamine pyrophosphate-dependent acetolactate synthase large subunit-like protein
MGAAALVGLGLAQAQPERPVWVITGDGEQLMGLGGLATLAIARPKNLTIVVLDNGHYGETGMQPSHTGLGLDIAAMAKAAGFSGTAVVTEFDGVGPLAAAARKVGTEPRLYVVRIKAENPPRSLPARDAVHIKNRLRAHLGLGVS